MSSELVFETDSFNGILVNVSAQRDLPENFVEQLEECIATWVKEGRRGVWVNVNTEYSAVIPQLVQMGFDFHHAQPGSVCLTKWLPQDIPNHLPPYANHYLGVAGFVVNSSNQILAIRERYHVGNNKSLWKLPGGLADAGEELDETAKREVSEETGVPCEFVCVLAFRHMHNYRHGCSDFYYVCLLRPLSLEIKPCPNEIAECKWLDLDEYEAITPSDINKYFVQKYREYIATGMAIKGKKVLSYNKKSVNSVYSACEIFDNLDNQQNIQTSSKEVSTNVAERQV
ncbi:nudix hydrolase 8-like [Plakobranchus ocellatus]|uniref:Nudix hydrolase 8-like n=1 Tax=Plakobranchus ocellatus TaxID=259542 RepID=A0AAV4AVE4_9GAST|nr:nudix hydrolase 8-like [Plakobranchus ocellatus]